MEDYLKIGIFKIFNMNKKIERIMKTKIIKRRILQTFQNKILINMIIRPLISRRNIFTEIRMVIEEIKKMAKQI